MTRAENDIRGLSVAREGVGSSGMRCLGVDTRSRGGRAWALGLGQGWHESSHRWFGVELSGSDMDLGEEE